MKARHWMTLTGLVGLVALVLVVLMLIRDTSAPRPASEARAGQQADPVDESPLRTARAMAALAANADERQLAQQVLRLADHEVDLAFSYAIREASNHPVVSTPATKELYARVSRAEAQVKSDQDLIDDLKKELVAARGSAVDELQQQVDLVQAQLELDNDELEDARGDLVRSGADPLSTIQRQFAQYQAAQHDRDANTQVATASPDVDLSAGNLVAQATAWYRLRRKAEQVRQAADESVRAAEQVKLTHESLEKQMGGGGQSGPSGDDGSKAVIAALHRLSEDQKSLADLDKRIQADEELSHVYADWMQLVSWQQRTAVHGMVQSGLIILLIVLTVYLSARFVDRFFTKLSADQRRLQTLRFIVRFVVEAAGVLLVLFVLFGMPSQTPTILGLAGAGLTVALKDFIVAFFGWFVLMGRNGIRVGDWVEINGVVGEVAEVGLLRTVLLETGNWTDAGHPTGRKVAFVNSFAIEGHFFNFSTAGQWLWDELEILVPARENPYPVLDAIQKLVAKETETSSRMAEAEWQKATNREHLHSISATPALNLRPTSSGVEVHVRYITRAKERYAMRTKLYQELVGLLHQRREESGEQNSAAASKGAR